MRLRYPLVSLLLVFLLSACGERLRPPTITGFYATPEATTPGGTVTLSWQVTGASALELAPIGPVSGQSATVTIAETTTFALIARNAGGTAQRALTVEVGPAPTISRFAAAAPAATYGDVLELHWQTEGATGVAIAGLLEGLPSRGSARLPAIRSRYTLIAHNRFGSSQAELALEALQLTLMIGGQSNAVGYQLLTAPGVVAETNTSGSHMFANDDRYKLAYEPVDDSSGQNPSHGGYDPAPGHSFALRVANRLAESDPALRITLLPTAKGGSNVSRFSQNSWYPGRALRDRTRVFGDALVRAELLAAQERPVSALLWYQGEGEAFFYRNGYLGESLLVFDTLRQELNRELPIIYVQLARVGDDPAASEADNRAMQLGFQDIREKQRLLEAGAYNPLSGERSRCAQATMHLVVAHDLPMFDRYHLTAEAQQVLGERISRAIRQHLLGEAIDGTGPRLIGISKSGATIRIAISRTINANNGHNYGGYFSVFDASGQPVDILSIARDEATRSDLLLALARDPGEGYSVRYMPPPASDLSQALSEQVVHHLTPDGFRLPLPAFGRTVEQPSTLDPDYINRELSGQCTSR